MRLRGTYLLLVAAASVAAMLTLAGPAAAANLHCGQTLNSSVTLIGNLDCSAYTGSAIVIGHDGVTLNLNGFAITGGDGYDVIQNYTLGPYTPYNGTTIKGGTLNVTGIGNGVDNYGVLGPHHGGDNLTVAGVTIAGDGTSLISYGVLSRGASDLTVSGGSISGVGEAVLLDGDTGDLIKGNTITTEGNNGSYGVDSDSGETALSIIGNTFTSVTPQTGTAYHADYDAGTVFSGNTVTAMDFGVYDVGYSAGLTITGNVFGGPTPAGGNIFGILLEGYGSGDVISGNYIRNSFSSGVYDQYSFNNTYVGNVLTSNGSDGNVTSFYITPDGFGPVTMVNNIARTGDGFGFYIDGAYNASVPGGPYSLFTGNSAIANGSGGAAGFFDDYSVGATWSKNVANWNAADGFAFENPWRETITGNSAMLNGGNGFSFEITPTPENHQPLAVTNNSASYNGGLGFGSEYPIAGTGNTGGGTNVEGDCYLVAGCS